MYLNFGWKYEVLCFKLKFWLSVSSHFRKIIIKHHGIMITVQKRKNSASRNNDNSKKKERKGKRKKRKKTIISSPTSDPNTMPRAVEQAPVNRNHCLPFINSVKHYFSPNPFGQNRPGHWEPAAEAETERGSVCASRRPCISRGVGSGSRPRPTHTQYRVGGEIKDGARGISSRGVSQWVITPVCGRPRARICFGWLFGRGWERDCGYARGDKRLLIHGVCFRVYCLVCLFVLRSVGRFSGISKSANWCTPFFETWKCHDYGTS